MGAGRGFRKVRRELGVMVFGVNAVVLPPGYRLRAPHLHERQEELYFVHSGTIEFTFNDGETQLLGPAALPAWIPRRCARSSTLGIRGAVYLCVGGAGGYVGRDGGPAEGEPGPG